MTGTQPAGDSIGRLSLHPSRRHQTTRVPPKCNVAEVYRPGLRPTIRECAALMLSEQNTKPAHLDHDRDFAGSAVVPKPTYGDARYRISCSVRTLGPSGLGHPIDRRNPYGSADEHPESLPRSAPKDL